MARFIDDSYETSFDPLNTHITTSAEEELRDDDASNGQCRRAEDKIEWGGLTDDMDFESENLY